MNEMSLLFSIPKVFAIDEINFEVFVIIWPDVSASLHQQNEKTKRKKKHLLIIIFKAFITPHISTNKHMQ